MNIKRYVSVIPFWALAVKMIILEPVKPFYLIPLACIIVFYWLFPNVEVTKEGSQITRLFGFKQVVEWDKIKLKKRVFSFKDRFGFSEILSVPMYVFVWLGVFRNIYAMRPFKVYGDVRYVHIVLKDTPWYMRNVFIDAGYKGYDKLVFEMCMRISEDKILVDKGYKDKSFDI